GIADPARARGTRPHDPGQAEQVHRPGSRRQSAHGGDPSRPRDGEDERAVGGGAGAHDAGPRSRRLADPVNERAPAPRWPRRERTSDGIEYGVRPLSREGAARARAFMLGMSPESRFHRFMHAIAEPTDDLVAQLVDVEPHAR